MIDNKDFARRAHEEGCLNTDEKLLPRLETLFAEHERAVREECLTAANSVLSVYFDEFDGTAISNDMAEEMSK